MIRWRLCRLEENNSPYAWLRIMLQIIHWFPLHSWPGKISPASWPDHTMLGHECKRSLCIICNLTSYSRRNFCDFSFRRLKSYRFMSMSLQCSTLISLLRSWEVLFWLTNQRLGSESSPLEYHHAVAQYLDVAFFYIFLPLFLTFGSLKQNEVSRWEAHSCVRVNTKKCNPASSFIYQI